MPLKTRGQFLCIDTRLYNALNKAGLSYEWDYDRKGLRFNSQEDLEEAMELKEWSEDLTPEIGSRDIGKLYQKSAPIKEEKVEEVKKVIKKGRLF